MIRASLSLWDMAALSPLGIVLAGSLLLLLLESFAEVAAKKFSFGVALTVIAVAIGASLWAPPSENPLLTSWIRFDAFTRGFTLLFLAVGVAVVLLSGSFFSRFDATRGEFYFLLFAALFGLLLIGAAADFLTLFLGLETLSVALYILCGYMKRWDLSHESSIKYFLIGSIAAALLLYGIALLYGAIGNTRFEGLLAAFQALSTAPEKTLFFAGIALVTVGLAFKAALVPFHAWAPDVYEGAPTPVTAFMAVGTKAGAFAALARLFLETLPRFEPLWTQAALFLVYPTLIYANGVALRQKQLRRFFAYSSISHAGFLWIPIAVGGPEALPALFFYLIVYAIATLGSFAVLTLLDQRREGLELNDLKGLFHRSPWPASILTLCLLTLAGIPPTVGFLAKFALLKLAFQAGYLALVVLALLTAILSAYYYLRIVSWMFGESPQERSAPALSWPAMLVGFTAAAAILVFSLYPSPLLTLLTS